MGDRLAAARLQLRRAAEGQGEEAYWGIKQRAREQQRLREEPDYEAIEMPRNSPTGFICAFFATVMGFALIWHIWWLAIAGFVGAFATFVVFAWRDRSSTRSRPTRSRASTAPTADAPRERSQRASAGAA